MKKLLAVVLSLAMCLGLCTGFAMAEEKPSYNILSIGDSSSIGYGMEDYGKTKTEGGIVNPAGRDNQTGAGIYDYSSASAFPTRIGTYVQSVLGDRYEVKATNLGMEGMRFQELRAILDPEFEGDDFDEYHLKLYQDVLTALDPEATLHDTFVKAVKEADCIILDSCTNSFGTYFAGRVTGMGNPYIGYDDSYADVVDAIIPGSGEAVTKVVNNIMETLGLSLEDGMVKDVVDALTYAYLDLCASFTEDIKLIRQLNPLTKIIVLGPMNAMDDLNIVLGDITVDAGALWGSLMELVDLFLTTNTYANQYVFADMSDGVHQFWQGMAECETPEEVCNTFGARIIRDVIFGNNPWYAVLAVKPEFNFDAEKIAAYYKSLLDQRYGAGAGAVIYDRALYIYMLAARYTDIDLMGALSDMEGNTKKATEVVTKCLSMSTYAEIEAYFKTIEPAVASLLHIQLQFISGMGLGSHPDAEGCAQKFEAVKAAWRSILPASVQAGDTGIQLASRVGTALFGVIKTQKFVTFRDVVEKIRVSFSDFFNNGFESFGK